MYQNITNQSDRQYTNGIKCPHCQSVGTIQMQDHLQYFICLACGFRCWLGHYRSIYNDINKKDLTN